MNPRPPHEPEDCRPFSEVLRELAASDGDPQLRVSEIIESFGERAIGAVMSFLGLLSLIPIPGATTVTGVPLIFVAVQLVLGRETLWLPRGMLRAGVERSNFRGGVERALRWIARAERLTGPRLLWATNDLGERVIGLLCLTLACVLVLPIWLGNFVPAVAVILLALGLFQRDGVFVVLGAVAAVAAFVLLILAWGAVVAVALETWAWIAGRF